MVIVFNKNPLTIIYSMFTGRTEAEYHRYYTYNIKNNWRILNKTPQTVNDDKHKNLGSDHSRDPRTYKNNPTKIIHSQFLHYQSM